VKKILGLAIILVALLSPGAAFASVDDFTFDSFDATYELSRDADGHSVLEVHEILVARFPDFDQNRGIKRAIPETYLDTPLDTEVVSVTDETGADRSFETESDGEFLILTIAVPEGEFVYGVQTYEISYIARNVILNEGPDQPQEFYWDVNGDGWSQPFDRVSAEIRFDPAIAGAFTGQAACYAGYSDDSTACETFDSASTTITASQTSLDANQTLTVAAQFAPGTFTPRDNSYWASPFWPAHLGSTIAVVSLFAFSLIRKFTVGRGGRGRPTIIAEYGPPPGVSLHTAAALLNKPATVFAAAIVDLAVRRVIVIEEFDPPGFGKQAWAVKLIAQPAESDREFVSALLGDNAAVGARATVSKPSSTMTSRVLAIATRATKELVSLGLRQTPPQRGIFATLTVLVTGASNVTSAGLLLDGRGIGFALSTLFGGFILGVVSLYALTHSPLTEKGAEMRDHIAGLDLYIRVAETDRLRVLQSPEGALRKPVDTSDKRAVLDLYELVLPWAILLGREKDWSRVLEVAYENDSPAWYLGPAPFTAASFGSSLSSFSSSASASSAGGSSGGGSAGGGGGGGGGGGV
jgi:uncharacterized membrane protein YgcG